MFLQREIFTWRLFRRLRILLELFVDNLFHGHLRLQVSDDEIDSHCIPTTKGDDDVGVFHSWLDEFIIATFDEPIVLCKHILNGPSSISDVSLDSPRQSNVIVGKHENLQVHKISEPLFIQAHDTFENDQRLAFYSQHFSFNSFMGCKVINWDIDVVVIQQFGDRFIG